MGVNMSITRMDTCDFENRSQFPITAEEVKKLVDADATLRLVNGDMVGDMIEWFPDGIITPESETYHCFFFDEKCGIIYSDHTQWEEIRKLVEIAEKLGANLLDEESAIYLPNGEVLDEAWKGESLWQRFRRWLKGEPRPTEFKAVFRWDQ